MLRDPGIARIKEALATAPSKEEKESEGKKSDQGDGDKELEIRIHGKRIGFGNVRAM
jgi:hypothetical protein